MECLPSWSPFRSIWIALAALCICLAMGCASTSEPLLIAAPSAPRVPPRPPAELMVQPPPSGTYLSRVQAWQKTSQERLSALPALSAASSPTPSQ